MKKALLLSLTLSALLMFSGCATATASNEREQEPAGQVEQVEQVEQIEQVEVDEPVPVEPEAEPVEEEPVSAVVEQSAEGTENHPDVATAEPSSPSSQEVEELFTEVDQVMYATSAVNLRSSYSATSDKLGSLSRGESITITGIGKGGASGWNRADYNGMTVYVYSAYLSTTKPAPQQSTSTKGSNSSTPSTQANNSSDNSRDDADVSGMGATPEEILNSRTDGITGGGSVPWADSGAFFG